LCEKSLTEGQEPGKKTTGFGGWASLIGALGLSELGNVGLPRGLERHMTLNAFIDKILKVKI
jgi:hypothetical protein